MSFAPFFVGKRACPGKTFAEMTTRIAIITLLLKYDIEFVKEEFKSSKPSYSGIVQTPEVLVQLKHK